MVSSKPNFGEVQILRDIRLSLLGNYREERTTTPPAVTEEQRRKLEHQGYQRGLEEAGGVCEDRLSQARAHWEERNRREVVELVDKLATSVQRQVEKHFEAVEAALIPFATEAIIKIVNHLPVTVDAIEASIRDTLGRVRNESVSRILVNIEDYRILEKATGGDLSSITAARGLTIQADSSVDRCGCIVETEFGNIDGRMASKITAFAQLMA